MKPVSQNGSKARLFSSRGQRRRQHWIAAALLLFVGFLSGVGFWAVGDRLFEAMNQSGPRVAEGDREAIRQQALASILGESRLHAAAATGGETFAVCTGPIDQEVEGLYILDFVSGDLQCAVLNFRTGKFTSIFRANVIQDLGIDAAAKRPSYLMVSGMINFPRGASMARPGNSVVYVLDTTTGAYGAYGIPWRREVAATGRAQAAAMMLLDVGRARTAEIR